MNAASLRQKPDDVKQRNVDVVATPIAALDPAVAARRAQLRYVHDSMPGITRHQARNGFDYRLSDGSLIRDIATLKRIRKLAIPPAWTDVWICRDPNGHLQATGRDQRGRKQYRYHPRWREVRDEAKYGKLLIFARVLPLIRARIEADLKRPGLPRERVLAAVVRLMELTLFRVGNTEYARSNKSFGLTTLRDRHVRVDGSHIHLSFRGKSGNRYESDINDRRLARIVKGCRDLPGYELFQYLDEEGNQHAVGSEEVNAYLREITGRTSPQKTSAPGPARSSRRRRCGVSATSIRRASGRRRSCAPSRRSRSISATRRRSAGAATFIRRSSKAMSTAPFSKRLPRRPKPI
jgi:DNA topoisomerase I